MAASPVEVAHPVPAARRRRVAVIRDLVESFERYLAEHRACRRLAGGVTEVGDNGAQWGVGWLRCAVCGVRWERWLALDGDL
jgi:hypothetical protein